MVSEKQQKQITLEVTKKAKEKAQEALDYNKSVTESKKVGLNKQEADEEGIASGIERAKQLINNDYIPYSSAYKVYRFKRFLGMDKTVRVTQAINLWGGRDYIKLAEKFIESLDEKELYLKGEIYQGPAHMDKNGKFYTGKKHTKSSKLLTLKKGKN